MKSSMKLGMKPAMKPGMKLGMKPAMKPGMKPLVKPGHLRGGEGGQGAPESSHGCPDSRSYMITVKDWCHLAAPTITTWLPTDVE